MSMMITGQFGASTNFGVNAWNNYLSVIRGNPQLEPRINLRYSSGNGINVYDLFGFAAQSNVTRNMFAGMTTPGNAPITPVNSIEDAVADLNGDRVMDVAERAAQVLLTDTNQDGVISGTESLIAGMQANNNPFQTRNQLASIIRTLGLRRLATQTALEWGSRLISG